MSINGKGRRGRPRKHMVEGAGFWDDLKSVGSKIGSTVINKVGDVALKKGEEYLTNKLSGNGRRRGRPRKVQEQGGFVNPFEMGYDLGHDVIGPAIFGRGRSKKLNMKMIEPVGGKRNAGSKSQRGLLVSKLMREKGLSLGQASKYIKEKGLM